MFQNKKKSVSSNGINNQIYSDVQLSQAQNQLNLIVIDSNPTIHNYGEAGNTYESVEVGLNDSESDGNPCNSHTSHKTTSHMQNK